VTLLRVRRQFSPEVNLHPARLTARQISLPVALTAILAGVGVVLFIAGAVMAQHQNAQGDAGGGLLVFGILFCIAAIAPLRKTDWANKIRANVAASPKPTYSATSASRTKYKVVNAVGNRDINRQVARWTRRGWVLESQSGFGWNQTRLMFRKN
jgi:hypothetical protein